MNRFFILLIGCCSFFVEVSCNEKQSTQEESTVIENAEQTTVRKKADSIYELGNQLLFTEKKYELANSQYKLADSLYQKIAHVPGVILSKVYQSNCLDRQYKPVETFKVPIFDALVYAKNTDENIFEMGVLYQGIAKVYVHESKPLKWREYLLRALKVYEHPANADRILKHEKLCKVYQDLSYVEARLYNNNSAIDYATKSLDVALSNDINPRFAYAHLLTLYERQQAHEKTAALFKEIQDKGYFDNAPLYNLHDLYSKKANYYLDIEEFDLAIATLDTLKAAFDTSSYKDHYMDWYIANNIANANFQKGDYNKVIEIISGIQVDPKYFNVKPDKNAMDMLLISRSHFKLGNYPEAEKHLQSAINHNFNAPENAATFHDTISIDRAYRKNAILAMELFTKAQIAREAYKNGKGAHYFQTALHTYRQLHSLIKLLGARSDEDSFISEAEYVEVYENLLALSHSIWEKKQDKDVFYTALNVCDESKTVHVLNELKEINRNQLFKNIPKDLLEQEKLLRDKTDSISMYKGSKVDAITMHHRDSILNAFSEVKKRLKDQYPSYYQLKYGVDAAITAVIEKNYEGYNLVEFFYGKEYIFIFNKNGNIEHFDKIPISENLSNAIDRVSSAIRSPSTSGFKQASELLYAQLLKKYVDPTKKLALVLDGKLHVIPFESLWVSSSEGDGHYLLEDTTILRLNSIKQGFSNSQRATKAFALAPFASYSNTENNRLVNSEEEATQIKNLFGGVLKIDEQASKQAFVESASDFSIIHLATHSEVNKNIPLKSTIYFSDVNKTIGSSPNLEIEELYSMNLNSSLVTLSSCETGVGKEVKGKGVMSMSNAFSYAGASATVMSLWKVPDTQTAELMISFYQHLSDGKPKDVALHEAKLDYLATTEIEALKHPYYWAGFVISGDPAPIESSTPKTTLFWWIGGILILVGLGCVGYKKAKKAS